VRQLLRCLGRGGKLGQVRGQKLRRLPVEQHHTKVKNNIHGHIIASASAHRTTPTGTRVRARHGITTAVDHSLLN